MIEPLLLLLQEVLRDRGTWCCTDTTQDFKTILRRSEDEGLSFLTITLPTFGRDLEKGLDQGYADRNLFQGFSWKGGLPRFLGGFLDLVFDRRSGRLLDEPNIDAIQAIRQITLMFAKINLPSSEKRTRAAMSQFIECEQEVRQADKRLTPDKIEEFKRMSVLLWAEVLQRVDESVYYNTLVPKHGPGATADRLTGNRKYEQTEWTQRLEEYFPAGEYILPNWRSYKDLDRIDFLEPGRERPVRVVAVPKTLKTPRIIAIEPACMQYTQQAVAECLVSELEGSHNPFAPLIGFQDQSPNQEMARIGSVSQSLATLDLSEASDRVSNQLVLALTSNHPYAAGAIQACRSRKADVLGHGVIRLAKFASMGSALCFPVEAMVFLTIVFLGIQDGLRRQMTAKSIKRFRGVVRVYGDDIIVPVDHVHSVVRRLEDFGLRVNSGKSFWTGKFRESCGKEYYDGSDVSIVRVRQVFPSRRTHAREVISLISLRNQFYQTGYWGVVRHLDSVIEGLRIPFPRIQSTSPVLGRHSFLGYETQRLCPDLQAPLVKGLVTSSVPPPSHLEGNGALLKWFLKRGETPFEDENHLERAGRPGFVDTKTRWAQPF